MDNQELMNKIDAEFNAAFQHLSNLSALAAQADLSGEQLAQFSDKKIDALIKLSQARGAIAGYLGVK